MNRDIVLNPDIDKMNPDSVEYKLYIGLYNYFFSVQEPKTPTFPHGIEKGDELDIRLKNTSFAMAEVIGDSIEFGASGGGEVDITELLNKTGDSMSGQLSALFGFRAGENGKISISTSIKDGVQIINIADVIDIPADGLYIGNKNIIKRDVDSNKTTIEDGDVSIISNNFTVEGTSNISGVKIKDGEILSASGNEFYHSGNSNKEDVNWTSNNLYAYGDADVRGDIKVGGGAKIDGGAVISTSNKKILSVDGGGANLNGILSVSSKVSVGDRDVLRKSELGTVVESSKDTILYIGSDNTKEIRILNDIKSWNGSHSIISKGGFGNFIGGISVSHNYGSELMKSYANDTDSGIIFTKKIRFNDDKGVYLQPNGNGIGIGIGYGEMYIHRDKSDSIYKPSGNESYSMYIGTNDDFISFINPIESKSFTIKGKQTSLSDGLLDFGNNLMIEATQKGMVVHGYTQIINNISSPNFSSGYTGEGWAIRRNLVTGLSDMTVDEMTVRGRLSIYELDVQMTRVSNGSLWVSDGFKADIVEQIS